VENKHEPRWPRNAWKAEETDREVDHWDALRRWTWEPIQYKFYQFSLQQSICHSYIEMMVKLVNRILKGSLCILQDKNVYKEQSA